jgi:uncharacterized protein (DUF4415 family)
MRKEYDFSRAKRAKDIPHLAKLKAASSGNTRITIRVDNAVLAAFKARAEAVGESYQTMINDALRQYTAQLALTDVARETIREEPNQD